jgi:hypothetical protein
MGLKFTNFAVSTIADVGGIGSGDVSVDVQAGDGAKFPSLGTGDYFYCVLVDSSANREVVKVTARSTDTLTIVRGQDGTTPRAFAQDDAIELRLNKGALEEFVALKSSLLTIEDGTNANTIKCTLTSVFNGDAIGVTDNISKGATTGNFTLSADGKQLTIEAAGLSANASVAISASGGASSGLAATFHLSVVSNDLLITGYADLTATVDTLDVYVQLVYAT